MKGQLYLIDLLIYTNVMYKKSNTKTIIVIPFFDGFVISNSKPKNFIFIFSFFLISKISFIIIIALS
ncbi:MAG: hypothetical protein A2W91_12905 [Bacteroidetes bacterium GWF2_38_335]|nr:MAG: hypothetical protein A2W91_12905 [Bacteroidetes bacterium GWF2_38_335]HBS86924.1 hypothetical protein [Bacteroidales bacterium]